MSNIKAVLFDYGNVLCLPQESSDLVAMAQCLNLKVQELEPLYWQFRDAYDLGIADGAAYWAEIADKVERQISTSQLNRLIELDSLSWSRPNHVMAAWVETLYKSGFQTAIISNMPIELHQYIVNKCTWLPQFHHYSFSCAIKSMKPDPEIFQHCLNALGLPAAETVFLDDREINVAGARKIGMHGIVFTTAAELAREVVKLGLPVPAVSQEIVMAHHSSLRD